MSRTSQPTTAKSVSSGFSAGLLFMLKAIFISYCLSVALLFITAAVATFKSLSDQTLSVVVNIITALGVLFCGFLSGRHFDSKGIVFGAICGTLYTVLLCILGLRLLSLLLLLVLCLMDELRLFRFLKIHFLILEFFV